MKDNINCVSHLQLVTIHKQHLNRSSIPPFMYILLSCILSEGVVLNNPQQHPNLTIFPFCILCWGEALNIPQHNPFLSSPELRPLAAERLTQRPGRRWWGRTWWPRRCCQDGRTEQTVRVERDVDVRWMPGVIMTSIWITCTLSLLTERL